MIASRQFFLSLLSFCAILTVEVTGASAQYLAPSEDPLVKPTCTDQSAKCQREQEAYRLSLLTSKCKETKKTGSMTSTICRVNGKVVSASEVITEAGDGVGYWFEKGKVVAVIYIGQGTLATFKNGKLVALYTDNQGDPNREDSVQTKFTAAERKNMENTAATGYRSILKKFSI